MTIPDPSSHPDETEVYWIHRKTGHEYMLLHHALFEGSLKHMVVYQRKGDTGGPVWVRPAEQFFDGRFVTSTSYIKYEPPRL